MCETKTKHHIHDGQHKETTEVPPESHISDNRKSNNSIHQSDMGSTAVKSMGSSGAQFTVSPSSSPDQTEASNAKSGKRIPSDDPQPQPQGDTLNPKYRLRNHEFFKLGKVFIMLWPKARSVIGGVGSTMPVTYIGENRLVKVQLFIVIAEGRNCCNCLPLRSYGRRGVAHPGILKHEHAIAFTSKSPPLPHEDELPRGGEMGMMPAIRLIANSPRHPLNRFSRINFGKYYTLEYNIKVYDWGEVDPTYIDLLMSHFDQIVSKMRSVQPKPRGLGIDTRRSSRDERSKLAEVETSAQRDSSSTTGKDDTVSQAGDSGKTSLEVEYNSITHWLGSSSVQVDTCDDVGSDINSNSDGRSIASVHSMLSGSTLSGGLRQGVVQQFSNILNEDTTLKVLCAAAIQEPRIGPERFKKNLSRLLLIYAKELKEETGASEHRQVTEYIGKRSVTALVSKEICSRTTREVSKCSLTMEASDRRLEQLLKHVTKEPDDTDSDGVSSEDEQGDVPLPQLSKVKAFMVSSHAWMRLRQNLLAFVYPTVSSRLNYVLCDSAQKHEAQFYVDRTRLPNIFSELRCAQPFTLRVSYENDRSLTNLFKCLIEDWSGEEWDWWPFSPSKRLLYSKEARLGWRCNCGRQKGAILPTELAGSITDAVSQVLEPTNTGGHEPVPPAKATLRPDRGADGMGNGFNTVSAGWKTPSSQRRWLAAAEQTKRQRGPNDIELHVFLLVNSDKHSVAQTVILQDKTDGKISMTCDEFFYWLRSRYYSHRGFWRSWLSCWRYHHCDFYRVEKFKQDGFAPRSEGYPIDNAEYVYRPKPMPQDMMPPISPEEFEQRFYEHRSPWQLQLFLLSRHIISYMPQRLVEGFECLSFLGRKTTELLPTSTCRPYESEEKPLDVLPKRISGLDVDTNSREIFWGLYAREKPAFRYVVGWCIFCLTPMAGFFFLWAVGLQKDLDAASVPFTASATLLALFFTNMWVLKKA